MFVLRFLSAPIYFHPTTIWSTLTLKNLMTSYESSVVRCEIRIFISNYKKNEKENETDSNLKQSEKCNQIIAQTAQIR